MKYKNQSLSILAGLATLVVIIGFSSCGEDPIVGCTDPAAVNFNPDADTEGTCVYARDKFIGDYLGSFDCAIINNLDSEEFEFTVSPGADNIKDVGILLVTSGIEIFGVVNGNNIEVDHLVPSFPYDFDGDGVPETLVDLDIKGTATMNSDETMLTGTLELSAVSETGTPLGTDSCDMEGTKQ